MRSGLDVEVIYKVLKKRALTKPPRDEVKTDRSLMGALIVCFATYVITAAVEVFSQVFTSKIRLAVVVLCFIVQLLVGALLVWLLVTGSVKSFRHLLEEPLGLSSRTASSDFDLSTRLLAFDYFALMFVAKRLRSEVDHLKYRVMVIIGPFGGLPILATLAFTVWKLTEPTTAAGCAGAPGGIRFDRPEVAFLVVTGYTVFYFTGALAIVKFLRMEESAQIVEIAVKMKKNGCNWIPSLSPPSVAADRLCGSEPHR